MMNRIFAIDLIIARMLRESTEDWVTPGEVFWWAHLLAETDELEWRLCTEAVTTAIERSLFLAGQIEDGAFRPIDGDTEQLTQMLDEARDAAGEDIGAWAWTFWLDATPSGDALAAALDAIPQGYELAVALASDERTDSFDDELVAAIVAVMHPDS